MAAYADEQVSAWTNALGMVCVVTGFIFDDAEGPIASGPGRLDRLDLVEPLPAA